MSERELTPEQRAAALAKCEKATRGPWVVVSRRTAVGRCYRVGPDAIANGPHGGICLYDDCTSLNPHPDEEQGANAEFCRSAREGYPAALRDLDRADAEIARLREQLTAALDDYRLLVGAGQGD